MRICTTGTSSMTSTSGRVPNPRRDEPQRGRPGTGRSAWLVRGGSSAPDVVLLGSGQEIRVAMAVAELLTSDGLATRVVAVASGPWSAARRAEFDTEIDQVAPPGVPRVTVRGDGCPETLEGIRLAAHDAVAAGSQGW
jgi:transketolase